MASSAHLRENDSVHRVGSMTDTGDVFAERLLQVIDEGKRTATYKLALLMVLIDACAAESDTLGHAPSTLHTRTLARHVLRIYLPQIRPYVGDEGELYLRQITTKQSAVVRAVLKLRVLADHHHLRNLSEIEHRFPDQYNRCLDTVELIFARYPILLFQFVGKKNRAFLYEVDWNESVTRKALEADGGGLIRFCDGAGDQLLRLAPLLRPLIELHWTRMVARINKLDIEGDRIRNHLFGVERSIFPKPLRSGLAGMQRGCFYCNEDLPKRTQIDHFIPWSRSPNNAIENLVLADGCNTKKSDYLPALEHVDKWAERLGDKQQELHDLACAITWESDPVRTLALARSSFAHLPANTPMWVRRLY